LVNKIYLGIISAGDTEDLRQAATPAEVPVGPFGLIPAEDMEFDIIGAYFETAKADLRPEALPILTAIADSIRKYEGVRIKAEGHCDYRRIHTREFPSNWELSEARAKSVINWLIQNTGTDSTLMEYQGFAATRPIDTGHTEEAWQKNRRVEVFLKGHKSAQIYLGAIAAEDWQGSTVLELDPVNWDTIVALSGSMEDEDRQNTWESQMVIKNTGPKAVQKAILTDLLPDGVKYVDGSCRIDGLPLSPVMKQPGRLDIELGFIDSNQQMVIEYRLISISGQTPIGRGAAEIQVTEPKTKSVFKSNEIVFGQ
jgi:outer membrane protein OmpA-like peptidoglycan-associated protein